MVKYVCNAWHALKVSFSNEVGALAKQLDVAEGLSQTGVIMGSPPYMAPEQAEGRNDDIGPGTDVYALTAVLYDLPPR